MSPAPTAPQMDQTGAWIAQARQRAGFTARELGRRTGLSLWDVESLEKGRRAPRDAIERIAAATGAVAPRVAPQPAPAIPVPRKAPEPAARSRPAGPLALSDDLRCTVVIGSIVLLVVVRFFTEVVQVLPRAANFVDIPILAGLLVTTLLVGHPHGSRARTLVLPVVLFSALCVVSSLSNLARVDPAPGLLFIYGFLAPFAVFWAAHRIWPAGHVLRFSRALVALGIIQLLVVVLVSVPKFLSTNNPDDVSGTFGENPYQLVFFLLVLVALFAGIFTFERGRRVARFVPVLLLTIFAVIFLAQYRSLLVTTALTVLVIGAALAAGRPRGILLTGIALATLLVTLSFTAQYFPVLKYETTADEVGQDPTYYVRERLSVLDDILHLYGDNARYVLTGTGPGTYSSRAWYTFAKFKSDSQSNVAGTYAAKLVNGRLYTTDVSAKYVIPRLQAPTISGSGAVTTPLSSWLSLMAEVGLLGMVLIGSLYGVLLAGVVRRTRAALRSAVPDDPLPALLLAAGTALFVLVQMAFLENWLEVSRLTFITATLAAVAIKEFDAREAS